MSSCLLLCVAKKTALKQYRLWFYPHLLLLAHTHRALLYIFFYSSRNLIIKPYICKYVQVITCFPNALFMCFIWERRDKCLILIKNAQRLGGRKCQTGTKPGSLSSAVRGFIPLCRQLSSLLAQPWVCSTWPPSWPGVKVQRAWPSLGPQENTQQAQPLVRGAAASLASRLLLGLCSCSSGAAVVSSRLLSFLGKK